MSMSSNLPLPEAPSYPAELAAQVAPLVSRLWMVADGPAVSHYRVGIVRHDRPWQAATRQAIVVPMESVSNVALLLH